MRSTNRLSPTKDFMVKEVLTYAVIIVMVVTSMFPLVWAIFTSLKMPNEVYSNPYGLFPETWTIENYVTLFNISSFFTAFKNSVLASFGATFISVVISCLGAYSLTRFRFPGSILLKQLVLDTYMIPSVLLILPIYSLIVKMGLRDNLFSYTFIVIAQTLPFCLWLVTSYFKGVSVDYEEAAMIDGATRFQAFYKVVLPQLTPAIITVGIQAFILVWNDLMYAKILLSSEENKTLAMVISGMFAESQLYPWPVIMAAAVMATVPVLFMFIFGVDKLVGGWGDGGVKG